MFYCNECRVEKGWPQSLAMSVGKCEVCGQSRHCFSVPSKDLPLPAALRPVKEFFSGTEEHVLTGDGAPPSNPPFIDHIATLEDKVRDLETCLTVMDVTLFCLMSNVQTDPLWMGQVRAAAEAYKHATGKESMLVENRCKKDFTKEHHA